MKRMLRLKLELFDYVDEQEKPEQYTREYNKQTALEMLVEVTDARRLIHALDIAVRPPEPIFSPIDPNEVMGRTWKP